MFISKDKLDLKTVGGVIANAELTNNCYIYCARKNEDELIKTSLAQYEKII